MYSINPRVEYEMIGYETVIYHPDDRLFVLNETATLIFNMLFEHASKTAIVNEMVARYAVEKDVANSHIANLISQFKEKDILI